jgi:hypothetical protein
LSPPLSRRYRDGAFGRQQKGIGTMAILIVSLLFGAGAGPRARLNLELAP